MHTEKKGTVSLVICIRWPWRTGYSTDARRSFTYLCNAVLWENVLLIVVIGGRDKGVLLGRHEGRIVGGRRVCLVLGDDGSGGEGRQRHDGEDGALESHCKYVDGKGEQTKQRLCCLRLVRK